ncbi:hypothetical protein NUH88_10450 [Nisaea acidiphila]|uniref:Uncharacterized protein n=1 Tax=Nisaea acidiphila TaxID=1862145 RepID=A0A9J7AXI0_9PROT|nr:hypothetical protein [Nisaea acidiphila]UUX52103.1 hypothetical protein NUH88_10450 [Nisaea acidiphila]
MAEDQKEHSRTDNGVVPSKADLQATGSWSVPLFGIALVVFLMLIGTMVASGDASAFFGQ